MIWLLLPVFTPFWWLLTMAFFIWLVICEERDCPGQAFGVLVFYVVVATLLGDFVSVLSWLPQLGWLTIIGGLGGYVVIGFLWGVFRYWWEQSLAISRYNDKKVNFLNSKGLVHPTAHTEIPDAFLEEWIRTIEDYSGKLTFRSFFNDQKSRIINWMVWWWLSVFSFFFRDFLLRFYTILLDKTKKVFERIENRIWGAADQEHAENLKRAQILKNVVSADIIARTVESRNR